ncbi:Carboxypeptidase regulatory-like domain-containing protein [Granulicella pectinivorans]|uniref:Carboxypeptidase regulatory-like domain-containing protein n=1 Tax=Granulicella pectinivorans TaxID=474950 RepID=A0A1I6MDR1_9BACT|nr:Carboxypeptidase regulatory-like domain-containing protein [Granulicella pectinivorans]
MKFFSPSLGLRVFFALFILILAFPAARAQSTQGTINGVITDQAGAVIAHASVDVTNEATGVTVHTTTNEAGKYNVPALNIGTYTVSVDEKGFGRYTRAGLTLSTDQVLGVDAQLKSGTVDQNVTITSSAPELETRTSSIGQTIEAKSVSELPLGNRTSMNIVALTGGAVFIDSANYSLSGGRTKSSMTWLDGGSGQNIRIGIGTAEVSPPVDTVQEIGVISNNYGAEFGGSAGGIVIQNTKSGTNGFHGSLYEFLRNDAFDAPGYFAGISNGAKIKPELRYNIYGGTIGGPIRRDRTFFFFGYEGARQRTGSTVTLTVPTLLQRAGDFSQTFTAAGKLIPIYDPSTTRTVNGVTTRTQFAGNKITTIDPVAAALLQFYPLPNRTPDNLAGANNFRANDVGGNNTQFYLARLDHVLTPKDRVALRYIHTSGVTTNNSVYPNRAADPTTNSTSTDDIGYAQFTHTFSPTVVNDLRFLYDVRVYHQYADGVGAFPSSLGLNGVSTNAFPYFAPAGFSALGSNSQERQQYPVTVYQLVDNLSQSLGRHTIKYGAEVRRSMDHEVSLSTASGAFTFATQATALPGNTTTGNGLASLLVGFPTAFSAASTEPVTRVSWYLAGFLQDDWNITSRLTLNLGLRWETDTPIKDENNRMNSFDAAAINPVSGTPGVVKFLGVNGYRTTPYNGDYNNFAPRFGFSYQPFGLGTTVVRGGAGIFYAHPFDSGQPNAATSGFSLSESLSTPDNGITAPFLLRNGVPNVSNAGAPLTDAFGAVTVGSAATTAVSYFDPKKRTGYTTQFNLDIEQRLPGQFVLELSGIGSVAHKLAGSTQQINQINPSILSAAHSAQKDRPFPQFGNVSVVVPTNSDSNYFASMTRISRRFHNGFNLNATYTFAKFLDNSFAGGSSFGSDGGTYANYYDRASDYGPSSNDIRHQLVFSSVYELPFGPHRAFLNHGILAYAVGGWTIGNVTRAYSGAPFTVTTNTNNTNAFSSGNQRANIVGDPYIPAAQRGPSQLWLNAASFAQPAIYTFGTQRRNSLRGPGFATADFSLIRAVSFGEGRYLQLRGEVFNALNHTNLTTPSAAYGSSTFGTITSSYAARQLQIGARIVF